MRRFCITLLGCLLAPGFIVAQPAVPPDPLSRGTSSGEHPVKYAIYSPAWSVRSNDGLRVTAHNQGDETVTLESLTFRNNLGGSDVHLKLDLEVPAGRWAETKRPYHDLLSGNSCVRDTRQENWRLMEISNYTLNPSVRGLIIEDTDSFRIFQCVRDVRLRWHDSQGEAHEEEFWVMYHFERARLD